MEYVFHVPRPPLNEFVERFWICTDGQQPRLERILPSGTIELVVNLHDDEVRIHQCTRSAHFRRHSGIVASGPYSTAFTIDAMQHLAMMGVHFRPGGASAVLGLPAGKLTNAHVEMAAIWKPRAARELRQRLCEALTSGARFQLMEDALMSRLRPSSRPHPVVSMALRSFGRFGTRALVREVAREVGLSHRRFVTIFTSEVGLTPKRFCRVLRFQYAHALARANGGVDWVQLALACGYFDQSHLANEFRELSGSSPTEYLRHLQHRSTLLHGHITTV